MIRWLMLLQPWWRARPTGVRERRLPATAIAEASGCAACLHFRNDPAEMEAALPGFSSLSSGYASVRGDDGLCLKHDRFVTARSSCGHFQGRVARE